MQNETSEPETEAAVQQPKHIRAFQQHVKVQQSTQWCQSPKKHNHAMLTEQVMLEHWRPFWQDNQYVTDNQQSMINGTSIQTTSK